MRRTPEPQYLMVEEFRFHEILHKISHGCRFYEIIHRITISHCCRFCEILHQNHNISWLQISWYNTPKPHYLMVANFIRYFTNTTIFHGCRFDEIIHQNHNISWLQISWDTFTYTKLNLLGWKCAINLTLCLLRKLRV